MPSFIENKIQWERDYDWTTRGEEWSIHHAVEWIHTVCSRIHNFVLTESILEIAPGFGRWTRFLQQIVRGKSLILK